MRAFRWGLVPVVLVPALAIAATQGRVSEVQVAPAVLTLAVGQSQRLHAVAYDSSGNVIVTRVHYRWVSANVNVARVDTLGTVTAIARGSALVRAEVVGVSPAPRAGAATVTVRR